MFKNRKKLKKQELCKDSNENENQQKYSVVLNKKISSYEKDVIGVNGYVESLKSAIDKGASVISISSSFGGGKSSICDILKNDSFFNKKSVISLWDSLLEKNSQNINGDKQCDVMDFYKSFLFQLAADYYGEEYSRYISKALNKTAGFLSIFFKTKIIKALFYIMILFFGAFLFFYYGKWFNPNVLELEWFDVLERVSLIGVGALAIIIVFKGRIVYTSWKSEQNRLLTIDDVTTLYAGIISDSIGGNLNKKNLIIIEDIDRCDDNENIGNFIKSVVKLLHFTCNDGQLQKKLNSIVLIVCIDESQIASKLGKNGDELLKLFEYRLDLRDIHHENFGEILYSFLHEIGATEQQVQDAKLLLNNSKNSIRLLKNELNDAFVRYNVLYNRYPKNKAIQFKSCIAYAYLKNVFFETFNQFVGDEIKAMDNMNKAIVNRLKGITQNIKFTGDTEFDNKLNEFIRNGFIDEDFRLYFYNYPKDQKVLSVAEYKVKQFVYGVGVYDQTSCKLVSKQFINGIQDEANDSQIEYNPKIFNDKTITKSMFEYIYDNQLFLLLKKEMQFNSRERIQSSERLLDRILSYDIDNNKVITYIKKILSECIGNNSIIECDMIYPFRLKLVQLLGDEIFNYDYLFNGIFQSINLKEFELLKDKSKASCLINRLKFNDDLEIIIPECTANSKLSDKIAFCNFWNKNVKNKAKLVQYVVSLLSEYQKFHLELFNMLKGNFNLLKNNERFINILNVIVKDSDQDTIKQINGYYIDFGFSDDSIQKFLKFNCAMTPIIYYLNNKKFSDLCRIEIDFLSRFTNLINSDFDYLTENIKQFKKYILMHQERMPKFDFLFSRVEFSSKFNINYSLKRLNNIHLLFVIYKKQPNVIFSYLFEIKKETIKKQQLVLFLYELNESINIDIQISENIPISILKTFPLLCREISLEDDVFENSIKLMYGEYKIKFIIEYQITCQKLLPVYYDLLSSFSNKEYKEKYAKYVNELSAEKLNIELLLSVNYYYGFNDNIISILIANNRNDFVVAAYIIRYELGNAFKYIDLIDNRELNKLLDFSEDFKMKLLSHSLVLKKAFSSGYKISVEIAAKSITFSKFNVAILELYTTHFSFDTIKNIFYLIGELSYNQAKKLIASLCKSDIIKSAPIYKEFLNLVLEVNVNKKYVEGFKNYILNKIHS